MHFMHSITPPVIHRDLKSPNILLTRSRLPGPTVGTQQEWIVAKVADFGTSRLTLFAPMLRGKAVDCPTWLAPEIMERKSYDTKV
jgi:leucine-rich repeat kinase 2